MKSVSKKPTDKCRCPCGCGIDREWEGKYFKRGLCGSCRCNQSHEIIPQMIESIESQAKKHIANAGKSKQHKLVADYFQTWLPGGFRYEMEAAANEVTKGTEEEGIDLLYRRMVFHDTIRYKSAVRDPTGYTCRVWTRWCRLFGKAWLAANPLPA